MSKIQIGNTGLTITKLRDGYLARGPNGTVRVKGADKGDTSFSQVGLGTINITRINKAIAEKTIEFEEQDLIFTREGIRTFLENRDIDLARVKDVLADPLLYHKPVTSVYDKSDGNSYLIDGNHRVAAHLVRGEFIVIGNVIPISAIEPFRIHMWLNGEYYVDNEEDIRSTFGMYTDPSGNMRKP